LSAEYIGRNLSNQTAKNGCRRPPARPARSSPDDADDSAVGIAGIGRHAKEKFSLVGLVGFEKIGREFGRLAETQRQQIRWPAGRAFRCARPWPPKRNAAPPASAELEVMPVGLSSSSTPSTRCQASCRSLSRVGIGFERCRSDVFRDRHRLADQLRKLGTAFERLHQKRNAIAVSCGC
jgi:hypothetical protein